MKRLSKWDENKYSSKPDKKSRVCLTGCGGRVSINRKLTDTEGEQPP